MLPACVSKSMRRPAIGAGREPSESEAKKVLAGKARAKSDRSRFPQGTRFEGVVTEVQNATREQPGVIDVEDIKRMADKPIVFAMANPIPEIMPEDAAPYVAVMATGRSDYPNQINNVLSFPGIFRGALACRAARINEEMKLAAADAIARIITDAELHPEYIVPSVFDKRVAEAVAREVEVAAQKTGVARRKSEVGEST